MLAEIILTGVLVVVVLIILASVGVFRKEGKCRQCGTSVKGTEQIIMGNRNHEQEQFILCKDCYAKIHPRLKDHAKEYWRYENYQDYLAWEEETREERSHFMPDVKYGYITDLRIDTRRGLFTLGSKKNALVMRFVDLVSFDIDFRPDTVKDGMLSTKVKGEEYAAVEMARPSVFVQEVLSPATYKVREQGFIKKKYEYELSAEFTELIRKFSVCSYIAEEARYNQNEQSSQDFDEAYFDEVQKALALFMFDSIEEVTEENLKRQRNILIKAFHPDNNESNEAYSQKINAAYDVLKDMIRK